MIVETLITGKTVLSRKWTLKKKHQLFFKLKKLFSRKRELIFFSPVPPPSSVSSSPPPPPLTDSDVVNLARSFPMTSSRRPLQDRPRMIRFQTIAGLYFAAFDERNLGAHDAHWRKLSPTATVCPYRATSESTDPCRHTRCEPVYASCHTVCGARSASRSVNAEIIQQSTRWRSLTSVASTHWSCRGTLTGTPSYNYKEPGCESKLWRRSPSGTFFSVPQGKKAALRRAST